MADATAHAPLIAAGPDELVAALVGPGTHVHCAITPSRPNALIHALARVFAGRGSLTVSIAALHSNAHALALSGAVRHVETGFLGELYPAPRPHPLYADVATAGVPFTVRAWSLLSHVQRLVAGAQGLPYAITGSLAGSDLPARLPGDVHTVADPACPERNLTLVRALRPDVTLVHGVCADRHGNVVLVPPLGEGPWACYAARRGVIASVERIVPDAVVAAHADHVVVPGQRVIGLCEAPRGAHPQSLRTKGIAGITGYPDDYPFLAATARACATAETAAQWYERWIAPPGGHASYLERLADIARPGPAARAHGAGTAGAHACATAQERVAVLTARAVVELVERAGYDTLFAGIGVSHLAAWTAAAQLERRGRPVRVCAELGLCGMRPARGDPFLFSSAHMERCEALTSVLEALGGMAAGNSGRCLGVLAAAEIDQRGNINTVRSPSGRWLTGSGGANDIGTAVDCVVAATAAPHRYVARVAHVTTPGRRVRSVVSQFGRFERHEEDSPLALATWLPPDGEETHGTEAVLGRHTSWQTTPLPTLRGEERIRDDELALLRSFDPSGHFR
ncbi:CoA-transferase [Streptomyces sp. NPDC054796]